MNYISYNFLMSDISSFKHFIHFIIFCFFFIDKNLFNCLFSFNIFNIKQGKKLVFFTAYKCDKYFLVQKGV